MQIRAEEISQIIQKQIEGFDASVELAETGTVISVGDGIARVYGLEKCMAGELLSFPGDLYGMALNLETDNVGAVLLGDDRAIKEGDEVRRTARIVQVPVGKALAGRVVNALGQPIDGKGPHRNRGFAKPRGHRPRRDRSPTRERTFANRDQGD